MERRLAAIVCADVAGYSRMMGADEAGTHASFKAHRSAIYPSILNHGGRLVKNTGDGFLLEFPSVVGAIEAAIEMQIVMAERNHHLPADRAMHFRIGVHMGDVMADEDEVFGDDVNIAVRMRRRELIDPAGGRPPHQDGAALQVVQPHRRSGLRRRLHDLNRGRGRGGDAQATAQRRPILSAASHGRNLLVDPAPAVG